MLYLIPANTIVDTSLAEAMARCRRRLVIVRFELNAAANVRLQYWDKPGTLIVVSLETNMLYTLHEMFSPLWLTTREANLWQYVRTNTDCAVQSCPWVGLTRGLGWVGSGMGRKFVFLVRWVGSWVWNGRCAKNTLLTLGRDYQPRKLNQLNLFVGGCVQA